MTSRATAVAPSNIAFVKYWGAEDLEEVRPANPSISMTLSECTTTTTVIHDPGAPGGLRLRLLDASGREQPAPDAFRRGVERHLRVLRRELDLPGRLTVVTSNDFPSDAGIASSASGFAALALAGAGAAGERPSPEEHSRLARLSGSGSACRSAWGGFVEWPGDGGFESASPLAPADHWELADLIVLVDTEPKEISSREGHRRAATSPHFPRRQTLLPDRLQGVRRAIRDRSLDRLGPILEREAIELHLIAMSSEPPIFYWKPATLRVLDRVRRLRRQGIGAWFTMDAGANVHVICETQHEEAVVEAVDGLVGVQGTIRDRVGSGPRRVEEHLA